MVPRLLTDGQELFEDIHTSIFSITALWQNCIHLFWGLALDILHIYSWMHPKSLKTADTNQSCGSMKSSI